MGVGIQCWHVPLSHVTPGLCVHFLHSPSHGLLRMFLWKLFFFFLLSSLDLPVSYMKSISSDVMSRCYKMFVASQIAVMSKTKRKSLK